MAEFRRNPQIAATLRRALDVGARRAAQSCASLVRINLGRGARGTPSMPGSPPNVQTGLLRNSVGTKAIGPAHHRMIVTAKYARAQEFGHPGIVPKRGKYLPVPVNYIAQVLLKRSGGNLRAALPDGKFIPRKGKDPLLVGRSVQKTQRGYANGKAVIDKGVPVFVLKKRVVLPARPFVRPVLVSRRADFIAAAKAGVASVLKGAG
jgi:hypothetical protein